MSIERRVDATSKNIEGKAQEALGNLTGNPRDQIEGKAKQADAEFSHAVEDIREPHDPDLEKLQNRAAATAKNIEGKIQEFVGDLTGNPKTKVEGIAKQAEAKLRHTVENLKE